MTALTPETLQPVTDGSGLAHWCLCLQNVYPQDHPIFSLPWPWPLSLCICLCWERSLCCSSVHVRFSDAYACRWLGHLLMVQITLHGVAQYACWINQGTFRQFFDYWGDSPTLTKNDMFLAGSIAWIGALPLWFTSMEWCRRRFFSVSPLVSACASVGARLSGELLDAVNDGHGNCSLCTCWHFFTTCFASVHSRTMSDKGAIIMDNDYFCQSQRKQPSKCH